MAVRLNIDLRKLGTGVFVLVWAILGLAVVAVLADETHMQRYHSDAQSDAWMGSLMRPDTGTSCCSLNDCNPTDAEWRDGQWWAMIRGEWTAIPPSKVLTSPISMDGEAWVCAGGTIIYCFVPPLSSY